MAIIAKTRTIKVPDETWERWQAEAKAAGCSTTALIIDRTEHAEDLREIAADLNATLVRRDEEIAALRAQLEAALARVERPTLRPIRRG